MRKNWVFKVTGQRHFPLDMLRYDACWPNAQSDVDKLDYERGTDPEGDRTVVLRSFYHPHPERWASFGWRLSDLQRVQV